MFYYYLGLIIDVSRSTFLFYPFARFGVRSMHLMQECFVPFSVAIGLQKDSLYTDIFSKKINQLVEGGFIRKWTNDEFDKIAKKVNAKATSDSAPLSIENLQVLY